ncbi:hypothetical protein T310_6281, partial [Rasamsonia emersonii CBS 393.64]
QTRLLGESPYQYLNSSLINVCLFLAPGCLNAQGFWALEALLGVAVSLGVTYLLQATLPFYPSPSRSASSRACSPHSSSICALTIVRVSSPGAQPTLVSARNCRIALVALGSPKSLPSGWSSAMVGMVTLALVKFLYRAVRCRRHYLHSNGRW